MTTITVSDPRTRFAEIERLGLERLASLGGVTQSELACDDRGRCGGCPFSEAHSEEAAMIQNLGCLPSAAWTIGNFLVSGRSWACHSRPEQVCTGFARHLHALGESIAGAALMTECDFIDGV